MIFFFLGHSPIREYWYNRERIKFLVPWPRYTVQCTPVNTDTLEQVFLIPWTEYHQWILKQQSKYSSFLGHSIIREYWYIRASVPCSLATIYVPSANTETTKQVFLVPWKQYHQIIYWHNRAGISCSLATESSANTDTTDQGFLVPFEKDKSLYSSNLKTSSEYSTVNRVNVGGGKVII